MGQPFLGSFGAVLAPPPPDAVPMPIASVGLPSRAMVDRTSVRDQGRRNSCTGFTFGAVANILAGGGLLASPLALYYYFREAGGIAADDDAGAFMEPAAKVMVARGAGSEALWPYVEADFAKRPSLAYQQQAMDHRLASWYRALSVQKAKTALALGLPIAAAFAVPPDFGETGADGVWTDHGGAAVGGHAVTIVGYDDATQMLTVQNSWGGRWGTRHPDDTVGLEGFCLLPYDQFPGPRFMDAIVFSAIDISAGA